MSRFEDGEALGAMARATDFMKVAISRRIERQWEKMNEFLYLVKFEGVEQIVQLPVFAYFLQFDIMLLQAMQVNFVSSSTKISSDCRRC
jgi:hypothetical protein